LLRGRHEEDDGIRVRDKLRRQAAHERDLLETDRENQQMRAEISVIESQMAVMRGALTAPTRAHSNRIQRNQIIFQVTAAERDEILAMRDRLEISLETSEMKTEELQSALEEAHAQLASVTLERDEIEQVAQQAAQTAAQNECAMRIQLEHTLAENAQLRETTVASEKMKSEHALNDLERALAETRRLDSENVMCTVSITSGVRFSYIH